MMAFAKDFPTGLTIDEARGRLEKSVQTRPASASRGYALVRLQNTAPREVERVLRAHSCV
jgi:hypothetical protein